MCLHTATVKWNADDYFNYTKGRIQVEIKLAPTMPALFEEIENDARSGGGLFDAYYTNPVILGTAATLNGFLDLTPYVKASPFADWTDVLLALRTYVTSFEDKIYIILPERCIGKLWVTGTTNVERIQ